MHITSGMNPILLKIAKLPLKNGNVGLTYYIFSHNMAIYIYLHCSEEEEEEEGGGFCSEEEEERRGSCSEEEKSLRTDFRPTCIGETKYKKSCKLIIFLEFPFELQIFD